MQGTVPMTESSPRERGLASTRISPDSIIRLGKVGESNVNYTTMSIFPLDGMIADEWIVMSFAERYIPLASVCLLERDASSVQQLSVF